MNLYGTGNDPSAVTDPLKAHTDLCSTPTDRRCSLQRPLGRCRPARPTRWSLRPAALDLSRTRWNLRRPQRILTKPKTTLARAISADENELSSTDDDRSLDEIGPFEPIQSSLSRRRPSAFTFPPVPEGYTHL